MDENDINCMAVMVTRGDFSDWVRFETDAEAFRFFALTAPYRASGMLRVGTLSGLIEPKSANHRIWGLAEAALDWLLEIEQPQPPAWASRSTPAGT